MLDVSKTAQVVSELSTISRTYGNERIIITKGKNRIGDLKRLSTFTGKYSSDDLFLLEKVKELLERNKRLLIILDIPKQNMDIYHY